MKTIILFLCMLPLSLFAQEQTSQTITLKKQTISFAQLFFEIEKQTGYSVVYSNTLLNPKKKVTVEFDSRLIEDVLSSLLPQTEYTYKTVGYHIIISRRQEQQTAGAVQTIRGKITDAQTGQPVTFASVALSNSQGTVTDSTGFFRIPQVPAGRYDLQVSCIGYYPYIIPGILVTSSKEVSLDILLREKSMLLKEVIVLPDINKEQTVNKMALTGGRLIRMEETSRFANGFDDPARLVSVYPGVAGNIGNNGLAIRGNSPQYSQWRIEGMEVPNPNHFADISGLGGGFLSALSTHAMGNSDFYNGAFPAEYTNALSGVFDMFIRNGNNQQYEHAFQIGLLGIDLASEGPLSKNGNSSYLFNYRFSTTSLATGNDYDMKYQDLTFKFHIPTKKAGEFSVWGIGLKDKDKKHPLDNPEEWETISDRQNGVTGQEKGMAGITNKYRINKKTVLNSSAGISYQKDNFFIEVLNPELQSRPVVDLKHTQWQLNLSSAIERRFSDRHLNKTGFTINKLHYDLNYKIAPNFALNQPVRQVSRGEGGSVVFAFYTQSINRLGEQWSANIGLASQLFTLNNHWTLEPRFALKWDLYPGHSIAASYGLHARREKLDYYFLEVPGVSSNNKQLDFSKAHHWTLAYSWAITPGLHFKAEPYYQYLYHIPVQAGTSFSVINYQDFYMDYKLINKGKGRNVGVDLSLERYLRNGIYYMFTASLFKSTYLGDDGIWRPTRQDKRYILNAVSGKEWMTGRNKQNMFGLNLRFSVQGGDRYTPVDEAKSHLMNEIELDETHAFSKKFKPGFLTDLSLSYRINKRKVSHEFSIKILNINGYTGIHGYRYNEKYNTIDKEKGFGLIPNINYKFYF